MITKGAGRYERGNSAGLEERAKENPRMFPERCGNGGKAQNVTRGLFLRKCACRRAGEKASGVRVQLRRKRIAEGRQKMGAMGKKLVRPAKLEVERSGRGENK